MAVYQVFKSLDEYYASIPSNRKILVNDLTFSNVVDRSTLLNSLITTYDTDIISSVPSCECGHLEGAYIKGQTCKLCGTEVSDVFESTHPIIWLATLDPTIKFISPHYWRMLRVALVPLTNNIDVLRWIADPSFNPVSVGKAQIPAYIEHGLAKELKGFERSYRYLQNNLEEIILYISSLPKFKGNTELLGLLNLFRENKDNIFSSYMPIVNKKLMVVEKSSKGAFGDINLGITLDAVLAYQKKAISVEPLTERRISNATGQLISSLSDAFDVWFKEWLHGKPGIIRKHIYGTRSHGTFRGLIVNINGPHNYDEIHMPWALAVATFRPQILNILTKRLGYWYKEANTILTYGVNNYHKDIDRALNLMLAESVEFGGKIPVMANRNPSLLRGSIQRLFITKFKKDPNDKSISLSILVTNPFNADYDGDELNFTILYDNNMGRLMSIFDPAYSVPGSGSPGEVSGLMSLPKSTVPTLTNYLRRKDNDEPKRPIKLNFVTIE